MGLGRVQRGMGRAERQIGEEGPARARLLLVTDIGDGAVDQVFSEVVTLSARRVDEMVVLHQ